ncbi:MAG: iron ABC transporter permease [Clostridia bacterium]|nr:iron ABC transporter permease [Clostridia bacterium]
MRSEGSWSLDIKWILILLIVDFLLLFQLLPLIYLIVKAFFPGGSFSLETFRRLYEYSMNGQALKNTMIAAFCTMILGTAIAYPLAYLVGRTNLYGRKFFRSLFVLTYMVPPYVGAMAWLRLLNKNVGTINLILRKLFQMHITEGPLNIYSLGGLIWVLTTFYFPYAFITISRAMEKMDPSLEEASRISGASPFQTVVRITLPMMTPSLIAGALLVFVCAASCYGIPSIIGAPGNVHTVTTRIIEYYGLGVQGLNDATGLAVFLVVIALIVLYVSDILVAKKQYVTVSGKSTRPNLVDLRHWRIPLTVMTGLFSLIAVAIPFSTILTTSFKVDVGKSLLDAENFTLNQWSALAREETIGCLKNSLMFGAMAATIGMVISCTMSYLMQRTRVRGRKLPDFLITLGSGTPSVVIALGLIMTMRGQFGVSIYNTPAILVIAYLIKYLMMGMRTVSSAMTQIHVSLEESSEISGAGWLRTMFRITGPLILPSIAAGWFLIFIPCFYELSMTTLLYTSDTKTIGYQLYQYWTFTSQPQACAMAFGILLFVFVLNFVLNKLTKGEFTI